MNNQYVWQTLLEDESWSSIPVSWLENRPGPEALLFRTHRYLDPHHNAGNINECKPLIHAAPFPLIGTSANRLNSQKFYSDSPHPFNFITVYKAAAGQVFYPDETLEFVRNGKISFKGDVIEYIEHFDPLKHFETDAAECTLMGTFLVLLPRNPKAAFSTSVDRTQVKILPVRPRVEGLLHSLSQASSVLPKQNPSPP